MFSKCSCFNLTEKMLINYKSAEFQGHYEVTNVWSSIQKVVC